jgi:hypothetical protein
MDIFCVRIILFSGILVVLGICSVPATAQDERDHFRHSAQRAHGNDSLKLRDALEARIYSLQSGPGISLEADSLAFSEHSLKSARIPLPSSKNWEEASIASPATPAQDESLTIKQAGGSDPQPGLPRDQISHSFIFKQTTVKTILADLRKSLGSACMTQPGNFHWFLDSQRSWNDGNKTANLVACNKASQWFSICVSSDTRNVKIYLKGL